LAYIQVFAYSQVRGAVWCRIDFDGQWRRLGTATIGEARKAHGVLPAKRRPKLRVKRT
jgi:hypothetical protein